MENKNKPTIVVEIRGGMLTCVRSDTQLDIDVILRDWDNIHAGDEDPCNDETFESDYLYELW